jgi:carbon monoxide dehydrogenase subunit G
MAGRFEGSVVIDRPIEEVFAFLADGENDPKFSPRVMEIAKTTDGPTGVGTVYASTVKDAGMKTRRQFEITEFEAPTKIRWKETSKNAVMAPEGGYDLAREGDGKTRVTIFNVLEGHGFGKLIEGFALRGARKDADKFAGRIKQAVEAEAPAAPPPPPSPSPS